MIPRRIAAISVFVLALASCGSETVGSASGEAKALEPVSGRKAFYQMYITARAWAPDVQALECASLPIPGVTEPTDGSHTAWRCVFVSPSRGHKKTYTYSIVDYEPNIHKGMFGGAEDRYSGPTPQSAPFTPDSFTVDSPAALETAMKASQARRYSAEHPDMPIMFQLEKTDRFPNVVWRVFWGARAGFSDVTVYVDAFTGQRLEVEG